jgi:CubicO group peptidase (beta-lactamase class C family)
MPSQDPLSSVKQVLEKAVGTVCPATQLVVRWRDDVVLAVAEGCLDPPRCQHPTHPDTLFDLASLTKLFTTTTFMTLVESGDVELDQPVCTVLQALNEVRPIRSYEDPLNPGEFVTVYVEGVGRETSPNKRVAALPNKRAEGVGRETSPNEMAVALPNRKGEVDAGRITFCHLLTHSAGLPAWRPLYQQSSAETARHMALNTFFSYPPGTRVVYSDIGLILVGLSIERLTGQSLPTAMQARVLDPLNLKHTCYLPLTVGRSRGHRPGDLAQQGKDSPGHRSGDLVQRDRDGLLNIAPTEFCHWRKRRIVGEVHDENAWRLGGVAGHAGLFSTAHDVAKLGQLFLDKGTPLLDPETVAAMTSEQARDGHSRRGLGFGLWSPDPEASGNPFSQRAFGHTGFTGTSLWVDPARDLVVALLTNEVYNGREGREILTLRVNTHRAVVEAIDALVKGPHSFTEGL